MSTPPPTPILYKTNVLEIFFFFFFLVYRDKYDTNHPTSKHGWIESHCCSTILGIEIPWVAGGRFVFGTDNDVFGNSGMDFKTRVIGSQ